MKTYIILFRSINVGGKNILPMKELRTLLEADGFESVQTYIQSGNVVLWAHSVDTDDIAVKIESRYGFKPDVIALEKEAFEQAVELNPFTDKEGKSVHFYFCAQKPNFDSDKAASFASKDETYILKESVFYLHAPSGIGCSKLVANIEACLGVVATGRNLNTVRKLRAML